MHSILRAANRGLRSDSHGIAASLIKRSSTRAPNPHWSSPIAQGSLRWNSSAEKPASPPQALPHKPAPHRDPNEQVYQLTFTCKVCRDRSSHTISKQGYHKGTILIKCPECNNRHLISDHLKIFADQSTTIESIMKEKGESVQRGSITPDGDVEFWPEGVKGVGETSNTS